MGEGESGSMTGRMPLPFDPQPLSVHQSRYTAALHHLWPWVDGSYSGDGPGFHREHVFDFLDGVRMIVARVSPPPEYVERDAPSILVSAMVDTTKTPGGKGLPGSVAAVDSLLERYFDLSGEPVGGEVLEMGLAGEGRVAWWRVRPRKEKS